MNEDCLAKSTLGFRLMVLSCTTCLMINGVSKFCVALKING